MFAIVFLSIEILAASYIYIALSQGSRVYMSLKLKSISQFFLPCWPLLLSPSRALLSIGHFWDVGVAYGWELCSNLFLPLSSLPHSSFTFTPLTKQEEKFQIYLISSHFSNCLFKMSSCFLEHCHHHNPQLNVSQARVIIFPLKPIFQINTQRKSLTMVNWLIMG